MTARGMPGCCATPNCRSSVNRARLAVDQARLALEAEQRRLSDRQAELGRKVAAGQEQATAWPRRRRSWRTWPSSRRAAMRSRPSCARSVERSAALRSENDRLKAEGQAVHEKIEMLQAAEAAACPAVRPAADAAITAIGCWPTSPSEHDALADRYRANEGDGKALAERKPALEAEDADLARQLRARDARQRQAAQAEAAVADGQAAAEERSAWPSRSRNWPTDWPPRTMRRPSAPSWRSRGRVRRDRLRRGRP